MPELQELLSTINNTIEPCKEGTMCANSPFHSLQPKCNECRLSPVFWGIAIQPPGHKWKSVSSRWRHPVLEKEKREAKHAKTLAKRAAEKAKDPARKARSRAAERAERRTNAEIIKATRNSGRVNRDGDHLLGNSIVLDTKLQSTAENPIVHLHELEKVRSDAKRNGKIYGVLCIKNKTGRGVCVIDERDFAKLVADIKH